MAVIGSESLILPRRRPYRLYTRIFASPEATLRAVGDGGTSFPAIYVIIPVALQEARLDTF